jgi:hypothetical protein
MNLSSAVPWQVNYYLTRRAGTREAGYLEQSFDRAKLLHLDDIQLRTRAASKRTFFILGSGASVNDLTDGQRALIKAGFSVGLNSWAFHSFVPDAYALENPRQAGFEPQVAAISAGLNRPDVLARRPLVFKFRDGTSGLPSGRITVPPMLGDCIRNYGRFQFLPSQPKQAQPLIRKFFHQSMEGKVPHHLLLDNGSTVVRMASLAALLGFRVIVLVGVDLGRRPYFFEEDSGYLSALGQPPFRLTVLPGSHPTEEAAARTLPFLDFLGSMSFALDALFGSKIYAGNDVLAGRLSHFDW